MPASVVTRALLPPSLRPVGVNTTRMTFQAMLKSPVCGTPIR
jgi:hypothetical protein